MRHPFELELGELEAIDLHFEEYITDEEAAQVGGGILPGGCVVTQSLLETGGPSIPTLPPNKPPTYTTMAVGEEGGGSYLM
jgi:hypothetical protein